MRHLPLLFLSFLCTCGPGPTCQAQTPDTIITVTKLPYPEAKIFTPSVRERLAPSRHERSEHPRLPSPSETRFGDGTPNKLGRGPERSEHPRLPSPLETRFGDGAPNKLGRGLDSCLHHRHSRLLSANLTTLQQSKKGAWLKYLPTVSAGLAPSFRRTADGSFSNGLTPTLSVGLNSSLIYTAHLDKQQRAATRESLIQRAHLQRDQELAKLHRLQSRLQVATDKLNLHDGVADIDRQLFTLYSKQYDNHEITPEEYLLKRKAFLLQELRNQDQLTRIETLRFEIEDLAGCLSLPDAPEDFLTRKK